MATYTPNYGLHQWVPEDDFLRTDFNEDLSKLDTALGKKTEMIVGSYIGTKAPDDESTQTINLPDEPKAIFCSGNDGYFTTGGGTAWGFFIVQGDKMRSSINPIAQLEGSVLTVANDYPSGNLNIKDNVYNYIAFV